MLFGIAQPALFDLEIQQGQITPVKVELQKTGEVAVRSKDTSYGGSAYGRTDGEPGLHTTKARCIG